MDWQMPCDFVNQPAKVLLDETGFYVFGFELLCPFGFVRDYVFSYFILVGYPLGIHLRSSCGTFLVDLNNRKFILALVVLVRYRQPGLNLK